MARGAEVFVVWTRILAHDQRAATDWMAGLELDERVHVFDDSASRLGRRLAKLVELPAMSAIKERFGHSEERLVELFHPSFLSGPACLFDSALVFDADARFEAAPEPRGFVTQLSPEIFEGLDRARYHPGAALGAEVDRLLGSLEDS